MATEKRLIDADAEIATIKENVCKNCNSYNGVRCRACWVDSMIGFIDEAPTVDAVEVVRCKDCRHYVLQACACRHENFNGIIHLNGYCYYGERKDNE